MKEMEPPAFGGGGLRVAVQLLLIEKAYSLLFPVHGMPR
jgi:hypothetical protein